MNLTKRHVSIDFVKTANFTTNMWKSNSTGGWIYDEFATQVPLPFFILGGEPIACDTWFQTTFQTAMQSFSNKPLLTGASVLSYASIGEWDDDKKLAFINEAKSYFISEYLNTIIGGSQIASHASVPQGRMLKMDDYLYFFGYVYGANSDGTKVNVKYYSIDFLHWISFKGTRSYTVPMIQVGSTSLTVGANSWWCWFGNNGYYDQGFDPATQFRLGKLVTSPYAGTITPTMALSNNVFIGEQIQNKFATVGSIFSSNTTKLPYGYPLESLTATQLNYHNPSLEYMPEELGDYGGVASGAGATNLHYFFQKIDATSAFNSGVSNSFLFYSFGDSIIDLVGGDLDDSISGVGGGGGNFDKNSDSIGLPSLPSDSSLASGILSLYKVTAGNTAQLSSWLYDNNSSFWDFIDDIQKLSENPLQLLISFACVPYNLSGTSQHIKFGGIDSGVNGEKVVNRYSQLNCGSYDLKEYFGNALDYSPYTKIQLYVPFYGYVALNPDECQNGTIGVTYQVDNVTGSGVAYVTVNGNVMQSYNVNMFSQIPLSQIKHNTLLNSITSISGLAGSIATGNVAGVAENSVGAVSASKQQFERGGGLSMNVGQLSLFEPYLIIQRPIVSLPSGYASRNGYPCNITYTLSELSGMTVVEDFHAENISCTKSERDEIVSLFKQGVVI